MRWVLDERTGLDVGTEPVLAAFTEQRARFLRVVATLDAGQWELQSRCSDWSVHDVVRHVRDIAAVHVARLAGRPMPFPGAESFHPAKTPGEWLAFSEGEPVERTVAQLADLVAEEARLLALTAERGVEALMPGPLRRKLHWSVRSVHTFWDAWTHERDLSSALGVVPEYEPGEFRLAAMYSLVAAAAPAAWSADYLRTVVLLTGSPDVRYEVSEESGSVRVTAAVDSPEELTGPADLVLDSLSGRGPRPHDLLTGPSAQVDKLTLLRSAAT